MTDPTTPAAAPTPAAPTPDPAYVAPPKATSPKPWAPPTKGPLVGYCCMLCDFRVAGWTHVSHVALDQHRAAAHPETIPPPDPDAQ